MTIRRNRPGNPGAATSTTTTVATHEFKRLNRAEDGYAAPDPEDRLDAEAIDAARARGFAVAVPCTRCGQWVVNPKSVAAHMGPVCRAKAAAEAAGR